MLERKYFILSLGLMGVLMTLGNYYTQDYKMPELHTPLYLRNRTQRVSLRNGSEITTTVTTKISHNISSSSIDVTVVKLENSIQSRDVLYAVVFGYPRTGSTFTGELFNQNPDAFYMYEPFFTKQRGASPFRVPKGSSHLETPQPAIPLQDIYNYSTAVSEKASLPVIDQSSSIYSGLEPDPGLTKKWHSLSSLAKKGPQSLGSLPRSNTFIDKVDRKKCQPQTHSVDNNIMAVVMYNGYHKRDHGIGKEDKLPVVELKPFITSTKKEWRPSRSWAWGEEAISQQNVQTLSSSVDSMGYPDLHKLETTPRYTEGVCAKALPTTVERKSLHPKVKDVADGTVIQREVSFVPKVEREKTTVEEIKNATMYSQYSAYGFITREVTEVDVRKQQKIQVNGLKMDKGTVRQNKYHERWEGYQSKSESELSRKTEKLEVTNGSQHNGTENTYLDKRIYDCFDRATTLPSITVKAVSQNKKPKSVKDTVPRKKSARFGTSTGYRLGVVNSLDVMSMCGKPLRIEQNLTNHLKSTLEQIKRTKDTSFLPVHLPFSEKLINQKMDIGSAPTIGEILISEGRRSNGVESSQSAPLYRSKSLKSTSDVRNLSRATTMYYDSGFEGSSEHRLSPTKSSQWSTKISPNQGKQKGNHGVILKRTTRADKYLNKKDHSVDLVPQNSKENMGVKPAKSARKSRHTSSSANEQNADKVDDASSLDDSVELEEETTLKQEDFITNQNHADDTVSGQCSTGKEQELNVSKRPESKTEKVATTAEQRAPSRHSSSKNKMDDLKKDATQHEQLDPDICTTNGQSKDISVES